MKRAEIITIGDELLIGQVVDTNSAWMAKELNNIGLDVRRVTTIGDDPSMMRAAFERAMTENDVVITTGGLGPTKDDVTKQVICDFFDTHLVLSDAVLKNIKGMFAGRNIPMNTLNRSQAMVPASALVINNHYGTAPVTWFEQKGAIFVSLPGVPYEMKGVMTDEIIPRLKRLLSGGGTILHHTYCVKNFPESVLAEHLARWEEQLPPFLKLAYLPTPGQIRLRLTGKYQDAAALEAEMKHQGTLLKSLLGEAIYAEGDVSLGRLIGQLLNKKGLSLATAESCTGGYLAHLLTAEAGASAYYKGGVVVYSNEMKQSLLGVSPQTLTIHGAVSGETASEMLAGVVERLMVDCAIVTTGIAGPTGGSDEKPVGTVWIGVSVKGKVRVERKQFGRVRENNIVRTAQTALLMLQEMLPDD